MLLAALNYCALNVISSLLEHSEVLFEVCLAVAAECAFSSKTNPLC